MAALTRYDILDTPAEAEFDDFTWLASRVCGTPIALISLVDAERQWFKSRVGLDASETPRELAFCAHAILGPDVFEVPNTLEHERFADNPLVSGAPDIRFYAGAPLVNADGMPVGTLCVIDTVARKLSAEQRESLARLGRQVVAQMELRLAKRELQERLELQVRAQEEIKRLHAGLKEHAAQVEHANRELTEFAYVVSHDLKAPLRGIGSLASWLHKDYADKIDAEGRKHLEMIMGRVSRMNGLIDGILSYSRAGRSGEGAVDVDLALLVPNTIDLLAPPAHIRVEIVTPLPHMVIEPTKAQQLFQNLLSNAIKYMDKPEGHIRVGCEAGDDGFWHFWVADNGPGIEEKYFENIFQLFQTLAPRDSVEGSGVGLALVKKIVELDGGRVWCESTPGSGTTFHFTLPKAPTARKPKVPDRLLARGTEGQAKNIDRK
jgi:signal transduction histidine kinase